MHLDWCALNARRCTYRSHVFVSWSSTRVSLARKHKTVTFLIFEWRRSLGSPGGIASDPLPPSRPTILILTTVGAGSPTLQVPSSLPGLPARNVRNAWQVDGVWAPRSSTQQRAALTAKTHHLFAILTVSACWARDEQIQAAHALPISSFSPSGHSWPPTPGDRKSCHVWR